jgi:hypothetical protein
MLLIIPQEGVMNTIKEFTKAFKMSFRPYYNVDYVHTWLYEEAMKIASSKIRIAKKRFTKLGESDQNIILDNLQYADPNNGRYGEWWRKSRH